MAIPDKAEQYPQKKMSIEEYNLARVEQFGYLYPEMNASCKLCGKGFGNHYGLTCPIKEDENVH